MVRIWRVNRVASALAADSVSEFEKLQYVVATVLTKYVLAVTGLSWLTRAYYRPDPWKPAEAAAVGLVTIGGIIMAFRGNKGRHGHRFVERYVCLFLPTFIRTVTLGTVAYLVIGAAVLTAHPGWREAIVEFRPPVRLLLDGYALTVWIAFWVTMYRAMSRAAVGQAAPAAEGQAHLPVADEVAPRRSGAAMTRTRAKVIAVGLGGILVGVLGHRYDAGEYVRGQQLTLERYTADFAAYKARLVEHVWPWWGDVLLGIAVLALLFAAYELLALGIAWALETIRHEPRGTPTSTSPGSAA